MNCSNSGIVGTRFNTVAFFQNYRFARSVCRAVYDKNSILPYVLAVKLGGLLDFRKWTSMAGVCDIINIGY